MEQSNPPPESVPITTVVVIPSSSSTSSPVSSSDAQSATVPPRPISSSSSADSKPLSSIPSPSPSSPCTAYPYRYFRKWLGAPKPRTPFARPSFSELFFTWIGATCGILALALIHYLHTVHLTSLMKSMIIGSFGASAVLIYGVPHGPLSQPRNLVFGHVLSALLGVILRDLLVYLPSWTNGSILAAALSVSFSITLMQLTSTVHPPGAATALIAVIGDKTVVDLGYMYVLQPVLSGSLIMLFVALVCNNLAKDRIYPQYWW